jgi:aromatic ring-opening dioxygenase catalytic subunit (LigB family)
VSAVCDDQVVDHDWIENRRKEGILILSGGSTIHNLRDQASFLPETASLPFHRFNDAVASAISVSDVSIPQNGRSYTSVLSPA